MENVDVNHWYCLHIACFSNHQVNAKCSLFLYKLHMCHTIKERGRKWAVTKSA